MKIAVMKINVLFFGRTHDVTGFTQEQVDVPEGDKLGDLRRYYEVRFPQLKEMAGSLLAAVNEELARESCPLRDGDEVAFLPPVSGGTWGDEERDRELYRITRGPIETGSLVPAMAAPQDGAVVAFEGVVRDHSQGRKTLYLEYEAYEPMAVRKMREIGSEAKHKFDVHRVSIIHRLGRLEIGDTSVAIIVTSAHRHAAFEACHYAIDRLKLTVPIWKKEYFEDGAVWAEGEGQSRVLVPSRAGED